ncbi:hypothetical protein KJZ61_02995 [Candidatus Dependentiae bacterium]|nr:hypothetical protein [Candidatus Dependentiae bacterium]
MSKHLSVLKRYDPHNTMFYMSVGSAGMSQTSIISDDLTEDDIIILQEDFLVNGLHHIQVSDTSNGRSLIGMFLASLDCYHNVACLTADVVSDEQKIIDLLQDLREYARGRDITVCLDEFLVERFYYDFLWIECSEQLGKEIDLDIFIQKLGNLNFIETLPIMFLHYTKVLSDC